MTHASSLPTAVGTPAVLSDASPTGQPPTRPESAASHQLPQRAPSTPGTRSSWLRTGFLATTLVGLTSAGVFFLSHEITPTDAAPLAVPDEVLSSARYKDTARLGEEMNALIDRLDALSRGVSPSMMKEKQP